MRRHLIKRSSKSTKNMLLLWYVYIFAIMFISELGITGNVCAFSAIALTKSSSVLARARPFYDRFASVMSVR